MASHNEWSLQGVVQDLIGDIFGPIFVFEEIGTVRKNDFGLLAPGSLHTAWSSVGPENKTENEEENKLLVATQFNPLRSWDVVFDDKA